MDHFWKGFEKRAVATQGPQPGISEGQYSRGGVVQSAAKVHPLPTTGMKAMGAKRISGPGAGSMPIP
jgi:hypothetical protein